jgi:alkanesulfonate monooxygenase SsuD/methylene tetrahydromethanopterin reductase-like flavin-dependent oxidoreductase (luciferase family)
MGVRFGYTVEAPTEWAEMLGLAIELDRNSRFDSFWIADALVANGPLDAPRLDAWTQLAAIAQVTTRIRLGVHVSGNAYRHPAVLAKIVTSLDHISGGRVELGIGAGWPGENRRFGVDFWRRAERTARFDEAMRVIKLLWTAPRPTFEGRYYRLNEPPFSPANIQRPHPPILIGGGSEGMLRAIATYADKASPMLDVGEAIRRVGAICREIGRDPGEITWTGGGPFFMSDDPRILRAAREWVEQQPGGEQEIGVMPLFGSTEEVIAGVRGLVAVGVREINMFQLPRVHVKSVLRFSDAVIPVFATASE